MQPRDWGDLLANRKPAWMRKADCRGQGTAVFFQERGHVDEAWCDACAGCVLSADCLEYGMADPSTKACGLGQAKHSQA